MDSERDLPQPVEGCREPFRDLGQVLTMLAQLLRRVRLRRPHLERQRDELLLRAVVQVALDPPPGRVRGGDDPRAGGVELGAAVGVRDRRRDDLGEFAQAPFGVRR